MLYPNDWPFWLSFLIGVILFVAALIIIGVIIWASFYGLSVA